MELYTMPQMEKQVYNEAQFKGGGDDIHSVGDVKKVIFFLIIPW